MGGFYRRGGNKGSNSNFSRIDRRDKDMPVGDMIYSGFIYKECENDLVIKSNLENLVPYCNGRIYLENKEEIGRVDEILGKVSDYYFSVRLKEGIVANSFTKDTKFFVDSTQTIPISRFTKEATKVTPSVKKKKKSNREKKKKTNDTSGNNTSGNSGFKGNFRGGARSGFRNRGGGGGRGGRGGCGSNNNNNNNNNKSNFGRRGGANGTGNGKNKFANKRGGF